MQRQFNSLGVRIHPIGLGAMPLSIQNRPAPEQAHEVIRTFLEGGGDLIDTANVYCLDDSDIGHNERLIRSSLARLDRGRHILIATKGGLRRPNGQWTVDGDPDFLRRSCEQSLKDLGTGQIFLYQLHAVDPQLGLSPSLDALIRLREAGKIAHIGLSNVSLEQLQLALAHGPIAAVQNRCNPFEQSDFRSGLIDFCAARQIAYLPHSPVGGHFGHVRLKRDPLFQRLASRLGVTPYQIVLAWFLAKGEHILPIPGASKPASIADSLAAAAIRLADEDIRAIDALG